MMKFGVFKQPFVQRSCAIAVIALASAAPSTASQWPQFGIDPEGSRSSPHVGPTTQPELKWMYPTGFPVNSNLNRDLVYATPTIAEDFTIYAPSYDGNLHAIHPDGSQKWVYPIGDTLRASATIDDDGFIYHLSPEGLLKLDPNGNLQFQDAAKFNNNPSVTVSDENGLYVGGETTLYSLLPDGSQNWSLAMTGLIEGTPVIGADGTIYFGTGDGVLNAVSDQGVLQWTFPIPGRNVKAATIGGDGTIYAGGQSGDFFAINSDGSEKWSFTEAEDIYTAAAIADDGTIVFAASDAIYALDSFGNELWSYEDVSFGHGSVLLDADGNVYATRNNSVLGLDGLGNLMWEFNLDPSNYIYSSVSLDSSGVLYFGAIDGVYAIAVPIPEPTALTLATLALLPLTRRRRR